MSTHLSHEAQEQWCSTYLHKVHQLGEVMSKLLLKIFVLTHHPPKAWHRNQKHMSHISWRHLQPTKRKPCNTPTPWVVSQTVHCRWITVGGGWGRSASTPPNHKYLLDWHGTCTSKLQGSTQQDSLEYLNKLIEEEHQTLSHRRQAREVSHLAQLLQGYLGCSLHCKLSPQLNLNKIIFRGDGN